MTNPIGFVVAMDAELRHLIEAVDGVEIRTDNIWTDYHFELAGHPIVAVRAGIGLVNAAAATERLINRHAPRTVLNYGCAGAHRPDLYPGDIVIGARVVNHSALMILPTGEERHKGFGYEVAGESVAATDIAADPDLLALAESTALTHRPPPWPASPSRQPRIVTGTVASADVWTQSPSRIDILHTRHGSLCEDMEAAAIAQVCALHRIPFLTIKDISNNEYHRPSDLATFADFPTAEVGRRAAALAIAVVKALKR